MILRSGTQQNNLHVAVSVQDGPLALTREGWVASLRSGQYATTGLLDGGHYPTGNYTLLYDGQGQLDVTAMSGKGLTIVSQTPGRMVVKVTTEANGVQLNLRSTKAADPLRHIRFIMPGHETTYRTQPFNPAFLKLLSPFKVVRFIDWEGTNGSQLANWFDRTPTNAATQAIETGIALEYMIQLANTLKSAPWFTIPIRANDDFVRQSPPASPVSSINTCFFIKGGANTNLNWKRCRWGRGAWPCAPAKK